MWSALLVLLSLFSWLHSRIQINSVYRFISPINQVCSRPLSSDEIDQIAQQHIKPFIKTQNNSSEQPLLVLLMGAPGAGKGQVFARLGRELMLHGLDEYLRYHPDYSRLFRDKLFVFPDAADSCYPFIIPLAKRVRDLAIKHRVSLVYEETGKDLVRLRDRVLQPFLAADYKVVGISVDTHPDVAVIRAHLRFLATGRFASETYVRASFPDFASIRELFRPHTLISCTNDCRQMAGSVVSRALNADCLQCDSPLHLS